MAFSLPVACTNHHHLLLQFNTPLTSHLSKCFHPTATLLMVYHPLHLLLRFRLFLVCPLSGKPAFLPYPMSSILLLVLQPLHLLHRFGRVGIQHYLHHLSCISSRSLSISHLCRRHLHLLTSSGKLLYHHHLNYLIILDHHPNFFHEVRAWDNGCLGNQVLQGIPHTANK